MTAILILLTPYKNLKFYQALAALAVKPDYMNIVGNRSAMANRLVKAAQRKLK
jgi:hypothetical protein